jgi:hypothetical protein
MKHAPLSLLALLLAACTSKSAPHEATPSSGGSLGSSVAPGGAPSGSGKSAAASLKESVEYDDGETRRSLWISEDLVAEFGPTDAGRTRILQADPGAREVEQPQPSVRIWRLSAGSSGKDFASRNGDGSFKLSPVLHEGPSPAMPMRALPGGVVATFPAGWDRAHIDAWLQGRGLRIEGEPVVLEANMYLVAGPPGLSSLSIASDLRKTGELVDVSPNFWRQNATR